MPVRVPTIEADPAALRRLASGERDHRFVERLWAVAGLAEGRTLSDVARRSGVHRVTLNAWCKAYRRGGIDALRPREPCIVRRRPRLNPAQLDELAALIRARPGLSRWQLWEIVKRRFGFDYTLDGLMRLVREELGFVRVGDRLVSA
jgi:transposase